MAESDEVERLRRVAYGPGSSARERAEAEAALRVIEGRAAAVAAIAAPSGDGEGSAEEALTAEGLPGGEPGGVEAADAGESGGAASVWGRSIRVGWLVPVVVGGVIVGVLATLGVTGQFAPQAQFNGPSTTSPSPSFDESASPVLGGDLKAADAWFDGPGIAPDAYPDTTLLKSSDIEPRDVRFALAAGGGWNVWVGRSKSSELCLLVADVATGGGAVGCVSRDDFAADGAHLGVNGRTADWYGNAVTEGASTAPGSEAIPPIPGRGPGDVDKAAEWFADPGTAYDSYPYPDILGGLGIGDGDILALDPAPGKDRILWLARQGTTGFCLLVTDAVASTSNYACVPVAGFRASGIGIAFAGFAAYWDGESVASSG